jgi:hypothetical protein
MSRFEAWLRRRFPLKELGWKEIGEKFTRWTLFRCPRFAVYLHKLDAPVTHPKCHDHPWHFWTVILRGGYWEDINGTRTWRGPGTILYRTARSLHNTTTLPGRPMWSLILVSQHPGPDGPKKRDWNMVDHDGGCDRSAPKQPSGHWLLEKDRPRVS